MQLRRLIFAASAAALAAIAAAACSSPPEPTPPAPTLAPALPSPAPAPATPTETPPTVDARPTPAIVPVAGTPVAQPLTPAAGGDAGDGLNRIVFVSPDAQIYTIRPDGSDRIQITPARGPSSLAQPEFTYTWPGWSPNGEQIVFSVVIAPDSSTVPYLLMKTSSDGTTVESPDLLFQNEPGTASIVPGGPHYALWSPDSSKIAAIVSTSRGQAVILSDTAERSTRPLALGAPLYLGWSPDSEQLMIHSGEELLRFGIPFSGGSGEQVENGGSRRYTAPGFAPSDRRAAFVADFGDRAVLYVQNADSEMLTEIDEIDSLAWFRWSPEGDALAVLKGGPEAAESTVWLDAADGTSGELLATGRYRMIMWSPDGAMLLLAEADPEVATRIHWSVMDVSTKQVTDLVTFTPSQEIQQLHYFFSQYAASHTFWSPDSRQLVFAGLVHDPLPDGEDRARGPQTVWTIDVSGDDGPHAVADGVLAFWSPR